MPEEMKKFVVMLGNEEVGAAEDDVAEMKIVIPQRFAKDIDSELFENGLKLMFAGCRVSVVSIDKIEESRNSMNRRWDDIKD